MSEYINNQTKRQEILKRLIRELHEGKTVDEVKGEFAQLLKDVSATEIAAIEQALIAEGLPETEIKRLCDVHVAVFRESLDAQTKPESVPSAPLRTGPGHPVQTFRAENAAAAEVLDALQEALDALKANPGAAQLAQARERLRELREYEKHYLRKENILFPYLERHGFTGPSAVMWAIHDDIRAGWKELDALLAAGPSTGSGQRPGDDPAAFNAQLDEVFGTLNTAIREMFYKEEHILFPAALQMLSQEEWAAIRAQEPEVGYCYVEPSDQRPPEAAPPPVEAQPATEGLLPLQIGALPVQEINLMLTHLPVDITYVDKDDTVRFFSQTKERIFGRSPAIIGRKVQKCHPPASVHRVQRILDDFRAGRRNVAEFWIQMGGKFIHIRYFALRDENGEYQGTLEVTQDVTRIRTLEGERRLLDDKNE
jgi:PAS domain S-box-containing protein